eukprot:jgi/Psemu1/206429/e_gw1.407.24.1
MYSKHTCDNSREFEFRGWVDTETELVTETGRAVNFYESFAFLTDTSEVEVCNDVDDVVVTCSSHRPHHYEYLAHAAARYVPQLKRVAIVGGSNGMLLHEILKYTNDNDNDNDNDNNTNTNTNTNTLEKVVILEPDQTLTRKSARHFATDPKFSDPRVEWWFGDIAGTLRVLPETDFGSFDLVLVDLGENELSAKLFVPLELVEALSMLLNPDTGIMAKTELYLHKFEKLFQYAAE